MVGKNKKDLSVLWMPRKRNHHHRKKEVVSNNYKTGKPRPSSLDSTRIWNATPKDQFSKSSVEILVGDNPSTSTAKINNDDITHNTDKPCTDDKNDDSDYLDGGECEVKKEDSSDDESENTTTTKCLYVAMKCCECNIL